MLELEGTCYDDFMLWPNDFVLDERKNYSKYVANGSPIWAFKELEMYKSWCKDMDEGKIPPDMKSKMEKLEKKLVMPGDERQSSEAASIEDDDDDDVDSDEDDDSEEFEEEDDEEEGEKTTAGSN